MRVTRSIQLSATLAVLLLASGLMRSTDPAVLVVDDDGGAPCTSIEPTVYSNTGIGISGGAPVISYNVITGNYDCCWGGGRPSGQFRRQGRV